MEQEQKPHDIMLRRSFSTITLRLGKEYETEGFRFFQKYSCKSHLVQSSDNIQSPFNKDKKILCHPKKIVLNVLDVSNLQDIRVFPERNLWKQFLFPIFILRC